MASNRAARRRQQQGKVTPIRRDQDKPTGPPHQPGEVMMERHHKIRLQVKADRTVVKVTRACGHSSTLNLSTDMDLTQEFDFLLVRGFKPGDITLLEGCLACEREQTVQQPTVEDVPLELAAAPEQPAPELAEESPVDAAPKARAKRPAPKRAAK